MPATSGTTVGPGDLLERTPQLAALEQHLAAVINASAGRFVLLGGEAGVGKTSVVRQFCAQQSIRVLSGACDALATPHPLGPYLDVAGATGGGLQEVIARGGRPYEVAAALLNELQLTRPSILVLEDLHWADDATLDVTRLLVRRLESAPALVIGTYRDDQLDRAHPLRRLVGELATTAGVIRLGLAPLSAAAVAELAAPHGFDAAELHHSTGGNPFFVSEVLAAGAGSGLPQTVQDAVLARVARLGPVARRLVEAVAIVPADVDVDLLAALDPEAVDYAEECLASGVLTATADAVAFRHDLARRAVEISLPPTRRIALHRAALAALSDATHRPHDPARLAHHAEGAGDAAAVLRFAPEAAAIAARLGSHREASAQYARALRFSQELPDEQRAELLTLRSAECQVTGEFADAIETREAAIAVYRSMGDQLREGDGQRALSAIMCCFGRIKEAAQAGQRALDLLEPVADGPELAFGYANRAMLALNMEDVEGARAWATKAQQLAERIGDRETLVHAINTIGTAGYLLGAEAGRLELERSLDLCKQWDLQEQAGRAYIHLAWASVRGHDYLRAEAYQREGIEYCLDRGLDAWQFEILGHQARRVLDQGRWDEAAEMTATILRSPHTNAVARVLALAVVAQLRARRGDPDFAGPLAEARELAAPTSELQFVLPVAVAAAEIAWLSGHTGSGRPSAAEEVEAATGQALELARRYHALPVISELTGWRRRCGLADPAPADPVGPHAPELAGDPAGAAAGWLEIGCDYQAGVALCAGSVDQRWQAHAIFQALDARPAAWLAARLLRDAGARSVPRGPRPSTRRNAAGLTSREVEVLGLIGQDLRNREIAQRLHLSEKTVDHHVGAILAKLGVSSRGQAAGAAARLGISLDR